MMTLKWVACINWASGRLLGLEIMLDRVELSIELGRGAGLPVYRVQKKKSGLYTIGLDKVAARHWKDKQNMISVRIAKPAFNKESTLELRATEIKTLPSPFSSVFVLRFPLGL